MIVDINKLKNIFLLHIKTQNYHLKYSNGYAKYHNVNKISLDKVTYIDEKYHIDNRQV